MKKKFNKEFVIGLSVIVAILILIFGIDYLKGINLFKPANYYIAPYENVAGLEVSAPVTMNGFKVGQVREINFDYENPGPTNVVIALDKHLRLPQGTTATITTGLLSGASIELKRGEGPGVIDVGGTLATALAPDLMGSVSGQIMPAVEAVIPKIDSLLTNLNRIVADPAIIASIQRLDAITANLENTTKGLDNTVKTVGTQMPGIMGHASKMTVSLDSMSANLADLSYRLKRLPLEGTVENVNAITSNLEKFSAQLTSTQGTLGKLIKDPELYDRLNTVSADIDSLIVDIKKNPKRYISIKLL